MPSSPAGFFLKAIAMLECFISEPKDMLSKLLCKPDGDSISDLLSDVRMPAEEFIAIGKRLQRSGFTKRYRSALCGVTITAI